MAREITGSILAADFGSTHTRAVLIDTVEGSYRLVARGETRTTDVFPVNDVTVGFDRVLRQISQATGRSFMSENGHLITPERADRSGVDIFVTTASVGRPLRVVLVGLVPDMSIASALRALSGTYIEVGAILSPNDGHSEEERLNAVLLSYPDVIFITGGTDGGAETAVLRLAEIIHMAVTLLSEEKRPSIIYSGNSDLNDNMLEMFGESLLIADNIRPSLEDEHLDPARLQLGKAYDRYKEVHNESFALVGAMSKTGILPTAQSHLVVGEYLGKLYPGGVVLVDVGSASSTLVVVRDNVVTSSIRTDLGLGQSAPQMLNAVGMGNALRWIPFNCDEARLKNYVLNKSLRPASLPITSRDLYIEHALLRAGVRTMIIESNPDWEYDPLNVSLVIGTGAALTNTGHPGYDALLMLDAIQPAGVTVLQSDPHGLVSAMGAIALVAPAAVVQLLENNNLNPLGTCVSVQGKSKLDKMAMDVKIVPEDDDEEVVTHTVMGGHLWVYPLPVGKMAQVTIKCRRGLSINGKRRVKLTLMGGMLGLIFDARGRPLTLLADANKRAEQFPMWIHEMTGDPLLEIDPDLLKPLDGVDDEGQDKKKESKKDKKSGKKESKGRRGRRSKGKKEVVVESEDDALAALLEDDLDELLDDELESDELDNLRDVLS